MDKHDLIQLWGSMWTVRQKIMYVRKPMGKASMVKMYERPIFAFGC